MEGISNNTAVNRSNYHATAKGAIGGAAAGAAIIGSEYGSMKLNQFALKKANYATKKTFIDVTKKLFDAFKIDTKQITVSKLMKNTIKDIKKPSFIAKTIAPLAIAGAAIGFGVDMVRNSAKRIADKTKNV